MSRSPLSHPINLYRSHPCFVLASAPRLDASAFDPAVFAPGVGPQYTQIVVKEQSISPFERDFRAWTVSVGRRTSVLVTWRLPSPWDLEPEHPALVKAGKWLEDTPLLIPSPQREASCWYLWFLSGVAHRKDSFGGAPAFSWAWRDQGVPDGGDLLKTLVRVGEGAFRDPTDAWDAAMAEIEPRIVAKDRYL